MTLFKIHVWSIEIYQDTLISAGENIYWFQLLMQILKKTRNERLPVVSIPFRAKYKYDRSANYGEEFFF